MVLRKTKEPQYQIQIETVDEKGLVQLGLMTSHLWRSDPKHLGFLLSRYKFCAKLLSGRQKVLEVGCADGFGLSIVLQSVHAIHAVDFDPLFISNAREINKEHENVSFDVCDFTQTRPCETYDAIYSLDVIEHISDLDEKKFMCNIIDSLNSHGVCIIGTPNICASSHASVWSQQGHINMKDAVTLRKLLEEYFYNVFIFSMNDEVIHTGFFPMAHYLMAVCTEKKE